MKTVEFAFELLRLTLLINYKYKFIGFRTIGKTTRYRGFKFLRWYLWC